MYEAFFHFADRPFAAVPEANRFFPAACIEEARQTLVRAIQRAEGPGLVIGPAGTGKSLLCQVLATQFRSSFDVVMLSSARLCTRRALLQNILFELNLPYRDREEGELRLALVDHLEPGPRCPNGMLLLVDEADSLPLRLLEEIRMITNLVREGQTRVRLVLAGGPRLEERFAHPKLESFNQRLAARCYLHAMSRQETADYVRFQIHAVRGNADDIFTADALSAVYQATDGVARLVNQICDHALLLACEAGSERLDAAGIEEAWADLQRLPMPWAATSAAVARDTPAGVIEFGQLDDDDLGTAPPATPSPAVAAPAADEAAPAPIKAAPAPIEAAPAPIEASPARIEATQSPAPMTHDRPVVIPIQAAVKPVQWTARHDDPIMTIPGLRRGAASDLPMASSLAASLKVTDCDADVATWSPLSVNHHPASEFESLRETAITNPPPTRGVDPFGDAFEEEEVVEDHYARLDAAATYSGPHGHVDKPAVAAAAAPLLHPAAPAGPEASQSASPRPQIAPATRQDPPEAPVIFDTSDALVDPRYQVVEFAQPHFIASGFSSATPAGATHGPSPSHAASERAAAAGTNAAPVRSKEQAETEHTHPADDRDLILLAAGKAEEAPRVDAPHAGGAQRQEYRQLFARLRRG